MIFLVLLQTALLLALAAAVLYWRLQTVRALDRMAHLESERLASFGKIQAAVASLQSELAELRERGASPAPAPLVVDPHPQPAAALSISKRSLALKMIRRGDPVEQIAAAVGVPQSQIRLLQKVHALIDAAA